MMIAPSTNRTAINNQGVDESQITNNQRCLDADRANQRYYLPIQGESAIDLTTARGGFGPIGTIHSEGDQEEDF